MVVKILIAGNSPKSKKIIGDSLRNKTNFSLIENLCESEEIRKQIKAEHPNVLILTDELCDQSSFHFLIELIKTSPIATLFVLQEGKKFSVEDPGVLLYGFVDHIMLDLHQITKSAVIAIRVNILAKLNIQKFSSQISNINKFQENLLIRNQRRVQEIQEKLNKEIAISQKKKTNETQIATNRKLFINKIIVIGASTGGPKTLLDLVSQFPDRFPPTIIVQHMPAGFIESFSARLDRATQLTVKVAENGELIKNSHVYVAPGGYHTEVTLGIQNEKVIRITNGPKVNFVKPAIDVTLNSIVKLYGKEAISIILTGMGNDGTNGSKSLKSAGGYVIALKEQDSIVYGMNKSIVENKLADVILPLDKIVEHVIPMIFK